MVEGGEDEDDNAEDEVKEYKSDQASIFPVPLNGICPVRLLHTWQKGFRGSQKWQTTRIGAALLSCFLPKSRFNSMTMYDQWLQLRVSFLHFNSGTSTISCQSCHFQSFI